MQSTPQTTIEAVMYSVRERGLKALNEPATQERLSRCDAAARAQINQRIEKLLAAGRIPGGVIVDGRVPGEAIDA
jgi:hypothetical protein